MRYDPNNRNDYFHPANQNGFHAENIRRDRKMRQWEASYLRSGQISLSDSAYESIGVIVIFLIVSGIVALLFGETAGGVVFTASIWFMIISSVVRRIRRFRLTRR